VRGGVTQLLPMLLSLRRRLGRVKWGMRARFGAAWLKASRTWRILRSGYPGLARDADLETRFMRGDFPRWSQCEAGVDSNLVCIHLEGLRVFWPRSWDPAGIAWVYREVFAAPEVNPHAYEFRDVRMVPGSWVVDVGASEGFFVYYALARGCDVLAVEPVPEFVRALELTFRAEIEQGRVRIVEGAAGESAGMSRLRMRETDVFGSQVGAEGSMPVRVYALDKLIECQGIRNVSFIKMDIEGPSCAR
jgi:FkbM family methyltransferase